MRAVLSRFVQKMKTSFLALTAFVAAFFVLRSAIKILTNGFLVKVVIIFVALFLAASFAFNELYWKRRKLPPGPVPVFTVGNMISILLNPNVDDLFLKWKQQFGGIFTFWMGPVPMVFVSDVDVMKKYFVKNAEHFSHRWKNYVTDAMLGGDNGVVQIDGDKWREQRRFSLHVLRDFGIGKAIMEDTIMHEVDILIKHLDEIQYSGAINMTEPISVCVGNIITNMLFGKTYEHTDQQFKKLQLMLDRQSKIVLNPVMGLYIVAPFTTQIPGLNWKWNELMEIRDFLWDMLAAQILEHKQNFNPNVESTDFTYAYLSEIHQRKVSGKDGGFFDDKQLQMLLMDLFFAGMETTVTTAKWGILMLILNPQVQKKAQAELDTIQGKVTLADKTKMVYINAVINEIQRTANILPINLLRAVAEDIDIDGFHFPAGTMVLPQISITMNDPDNFEDPKRFNPDRFIDENGNLKKVEALMPFSIGKRQCLGESLARAELFLIFSNLLKNFEFSCEDVGNLPSAERQYGLTVSPKPYKCVVKKRF